VKQRLLLLLVGCALLFFFGLLLFPVSWFCAASFLHVSVITFFLVGSSIDGSCVGTFPVRVLSAGLDAVGSVVLACPST